MRAEQHIDEGESPPAVSNATTGFHLRYPKKPAKWNEMDSIKKPVTKKQHGIPLTLRYRRRTLYLLLLYLPLLIVPWVLICVLADRPVGASSYISQSGGLSSAQLVATSRLSTVIRIFNAIAGVFTIPIVSAVLAQAAVVYSQRRKASQSLTMKQLFVLADRSWNSLPTLWEIVRRNEEGNSTRFLWFAAGLTLVSILVQPIQQALVTYIPYTVMSCNDLPYQQCDPLDTWVTQGYDPEPGDLAQMPQNLIVQDIRAQLASFNELTIHPRMWSENPIVGGSSYGSFFDALLPAQRETFSYYDDGYNNDARYFVTALPDGTTTGVLRQHAMRLNSSVSCNPIPRSNFPFVCLGARPFTFAAQFKQNLGIQVCVPGEYGTSPWNSSRHRQDISEEFYLDVYVPYSLPNDTNNFTLHCQAGTTRGYFELGNWRNNYTYGMLEENWPDPEEMRSDWNDYRSSPYSFALAGENDTTEGQWIHWPQTPDAFSTDELVSPGPLMSTMISLFGNGSLFYIAANAQDNSFSELIRICQQSLVPFSQLNVPGYAFPQYCAQVTQPNYLSLPSEQKDQLLAFFLEAWVLLFNFTGYPEQLINAGMFFANQALLTETAAVTSESTARLIFYSAGTTITKPEKTIAATVIVSALVLLQVVGLLCLAWYIYRVPTWTPALNAAAMAQIGAMMTGSNLPPMGPLYEEDKAKLRDLPGVVGLVQDGKSTVTRGGDLALQHSQDSTILPTDAQARALDEEKAYGGEQDQQKEPNTLITSLNAEPVNTTHELTPRSANSRNEQRDQVKLGLNGPGLITRHMAPSFWQRKSPSKTTRDTQV